MKRLVWRKGWWRGAKRVRSPNFGPRPDSADITLAILHSISLPPGVYGGDAVQHLFTNRLDTTEHPYYAQLEGLQVSAHFFVRRDGRTLQFVSCDERAWHAGASQWGGREDCNDWSIGIELEGLDGQAFTPVQYRSLIRLLCALGRRYRIAEVVGHEHVAPGRKTDPGSRFAWPRLSRVFARRGIFVAR